MEIKRDTYLNKLISKKNNGLIKVVTGVRRCGKSYLLFTLFKNYLLSAGTDEQHIIEIAFDAFENRQFRDPDVLYPYLKEKIQGDDMYYVLLDEVQLLGEFEAVLNSLIRMKNVDVYVTGSNAKFLSKDVITEFRGRGDEVHMYPLSFAEFMSVYPGTKQDGWNEYMIYGGLPLVLSFQTQEEKITFLKSLFEETYISDIVGRHKIRNRAELEELLNVLSSAIGSLTNPSKLSATFKSVKQKTISKTTIKNYLDYLMDSFLIDSAVRYDIKGKKYIDTPVKYYFTDMGLRNARLNFRQLEETHTMENIIFNELKIRGFNVDVGVVTINSTNGKGNGIRKQLEIDFVCNKGSKRYYIQSAYAIPDQAKMEQEQRSLVMTGDFFKKIIITKDAPASYYNDDGVLIMSIYDFLLNSDSLEM
ncbi:ATPase [Enterococcus faecium]|uniref:ATPase n=1 Tax=Enterococcus faecium TaxID=1352 RepID=A0A679C3W9_ENTFC|nr:ATP-binding protein [Enterococcus faecium]BBI93295.1 ATPase [Enterococcus faecium]BCZ34690.1 ATPase [Enterococcus faecium]BCZ37892.1 ATPase [Enterococcus faecium]